MNLPTYCRFDTCTSFWGSRAAGMWSSPLISGNLKKAWNIAPPPPASSRRVWTFHVPVHWILEGIKRPECEVDHLLVVSSRRCGTLFPLPNCVIMAFCLSTGSAYLHCTILITIYSFGFRVVLVINGYSFPNNCSSLVVAVDLHWVFSAVGCSF